MLSGRSCLCLGHIFRGKWLQRISQIRKCVPLSIFLLLLTRWQLYAFLFTTKLDLGKGRLLLLLEVYISPRAQFPLGNSGDMSTHFWFLLDDLPITSLYLCHPTVQLLIKRGAEQYHDIFIRNACSYCSALRDIELMRSSEWLTFHSRSYLSG